MKVEPGMIVEREYKEGRVWFVVVDKESRLYCIYDEDGSIFSFNGQIKKGIYFGDKVYKNGELISNDY